MTRPRFIRFPRFVRFIRFPRFIRFLRFVRFLRFSRMTEIAVPSDAIRREYGGGTGILACRFSNTNEVAITGPLLPGLPIEFHPFLALPPD